MFVNFSEETRHLLKGAEKQREELNHPYVGSEHIFLSILKEGRLKEVFHKHKLTYKKFKDKLVNLVGIGNKKSEFVLYTPLLKRVLENAVIGAREENNKIVNPEILIISILDEEDGVAFSILKTLKINIDRLYYDLKNMNNKKRNKRKKLLLEDIGSNLTKLAREKKIDPVIGRNSEINKTMEILLRRKKNNPILIGPAGVGKTAIVEGLANLIVSNKCPYFLQDKKIISLNIFSLVSGTKYRGEFEEKMKTIIKEMEENDDIILFIDEVHTMVGAGGAEGAIDASNIFKPALARGQIRIIGATTIDEYKKYIEPDAALARRFQIVNVEEPDKENVIKILTEIKPLYEKYHNIKISNSLITEIVNLSSKYLTNRFEPDRSIDILDEVCAKVSTIESTYEKKKKILEKRLYQINNEKIRALSNQNFKRAYSLKNEEKEILLTIQNTKSNKKQVTKNDILEVIKSKGNIKDVGAILKDSTYYDDLEKKLEQEVMGQSSNINKLILSLKKKNITNKKKCYSVLITGNPSSGKYFLAHAYLKKLVDEKNILNIDLSEYLEHHTISKLIGTTAGYLGYDNKNNIFEKVRLNPASALIINNFEKGCEEVKDLFIKILKQGYIEDASGKRIDFSNTIMVFLSNVEDSNKLGFNSLEGDDLGTLSNRLLSNLDVKIKMKPLSDNDKFNIVRNKLIGDSKEFDRFNINITEEYISEVYDKYKNKKELSNIISSVLEDFENKVIDMITNNYNEKEIVIGENIKV